MYQPQVQKESLTFKNITASRGLIPITTQKGSVIAPTLNDLNQTNKPPLGDDAFASVQTFSPDFLQSFVYQKQLLSKRVSLNTELLG